MENENQRTNEVKNAKIVYSMKIAKELINKGHRVLATMPNPEDKRYIAWLFEVNDTFNEDFISLKGATANGR